MVAVRSNLSGLLDSAVRDAHSIVDAVKAIEHAKTIRDIDQLREAMDLRAELVVDFSITLTELQKLGHHELAAVLLKGTLGNCAVARALARNARRRQSGSVLPLPPSPA